MHHHGRSRLRHRQADHHLQQVQAHRLTFRSRLRVPNAVAIATAFLLSCAHAGAERGPVFEAGGWFRVGRPPANWELVRNRRWGRRLLLDYRVKGEDVDLRVTVHPLDEAGRRIPLPILAEGVVRGYGRSRGVVTDVDAIQRADFGDHEGVVVHFRRTAGPVVRQLSQAWIRAGEWVVVLTYVAPPEAFETYAPEFALALQRFEVLLPADAPVMGVAAPSDLATPAPPPADPGPLPVTTPRE